MTPQVIPGENVFFKRKNMTFCLGVYQLPIVNNVRNKIMEAEEVYVPDLAYMGQC